MDFEYYDYDCQYDSLEEEMVDKGEIVGFDGKYYY